jgi:hypothetical protein
LTRLCSCNLYFYKRGGYNYRHIQLDPSDIETVDSKFYLILDGVYSFVYDEKTRLIEFILNGKSISYPFKTRYKNNKIFPIASINSNTEISIIKFEKVSIEEKLKKEIFFMKHFKYATLKNFEIGKRIGAKNYNNLKLKENEFYGVCSAIYEVYYYGVPFAMKIILNYNNNKNSKEILKNNENEVKILKKLSKYPFNKNIIYLFNEFVDTIDKKKFEKWNFDDVVKYPSKIRL